MNKMKKIEKRKGFLLAIVVLMNLICIGGIRRFKRNHKNYVCSQRDYEE